MVVEQCVAEAAKQCVAEAAEQGGVKAAGQGGQRRRGRVGWRWRGRVRQRHQESNRGTSLAEALGEGELAYEEARPKWVGREGPEQWGNTRLGRRGSRAPAAGVAHQGWASLLNAVAGTGYGFKVVWERLGWCRGGAHPTCPHPTCNMPQVVNSKLRRCNEHSASLVPYSDMQLLCVSV